MVVSINEMCIMKFGHPRWMWVITMYVVAMVAFVNISRINEPCSLATLFNFLQLLGVSVYMVACIDRGIL